MCFLANHRSNGPLIYSAFFREPGNSREGLLDISVGGHDICNTYNSNRSGNGTWLKPLVFCWCRFGGASLVVIQLAHSVIRGNVLNGAEADCPNLTSPDRQVRHCPSLFLPRTPDWAGMLLVYSEQHKL